MKASDLNLQQLALVVARHERPDKPWEIRNGKTIYLEEHNHQYYETSFRINWNTIGPIWERDCGNIAFFSFERAYYASKSPESIARALVDMWYPEISEEMIK